MVYPKCLDVLVVALGHTVENSLAHVATQQGWTMFRSLTASHALRELFQCRPRVAIVQLSHSIEESLNLIRVARGHWRPVSLIAVAPTHDHDIEITVRETGASYYALDAVNAGLVTQAVASILLPQPTHSNNPQHLSAHGEGAIDRFPAA